MLHPTILPCSSYLHCLLVLQLLLFFPLLSTGTAPTPPHLSNVHSLLSHPHLSPSLSPSQHSEATHSVIHVRAGPIHVHKQQRDLAQQAVHSYTQHRQQAAAALASSSSSSSSPSRHRFSPFSASVSSRSAANVSLALYLLHLKSPVTSRALSTLSSFLSPHSSFPLSFSNIIPVSSLLLLAPFTPAFVSALHSAPAVLYFTTLQPVDKLSPSLRDRWEQVEQPEEEREEEDDAALDWMLHLYEGEGVDAADVARELQAEAELLTADCTLTATRGGYLHFHLPARPLLRSSMAAGLSSSSSVALQLLRLLASSPFVTFLHLLAVHAMQNRFVHSIVAPALSRSSAVNSSSAALNLSFCLAHNLTGLSQVLAHSDTGVDFDSCFFADPLHPMTALSVNRLQPLHRKILLYSTMGRPFTPDVRDGHGTHTAGSLAGSLLLPPGQRGNSSNYALLSEFNGLAPDSRLAVYAFTAANGQLQVPHDIVSSFYYPLHADDDGPRAAVASNSWGSANGDYDSYCRDTDAFTFAHPTFLPLFAAGNYGEDGFHSISSPALAKNVLTVGSSESSRQSFAWQAVGIRVGGSNHSVVPAEFGPPFREAKLAAGTALVVATPISGCGFNTSEASYSRLNGSMVLLSRGDCYFSEKARRLQQAGAVLMLVAQLEDLPPFAMSASSSSEMEAEPITIPAAMVSFEVAQLLMEAAGTGAEVRAPVGLLSSNGGEDVLSSFSSRGPTYDGRLKPDLVAPGEYVISVRSDGVISAEISCPASSATALLALEGTSMATPAVAASAVLIRQYLQRGDYGSLSITPTAALLKAMLLHSGVSIGGRVVSRRRQGGNEVEDVRPAPSVFQGYGRLQLEKALYYDSEPEWMGKRLFLADRGVDEARRLRAASTGARDKTEQQAEVGREEIRHFCFRLQLPTAPMTLSEPAFRATLVWTDPAPVILTSHYLVNDLDLIVVLGGRDDALYIGNSDYNSYREEDGSTASHWDSANNVEQVSINASQLLPFHSASVSVHVRASSFSPSFTQQTFALAVSGPLSAALPLASCASPLLCPRNCSGQGSCSSLGLCECVFPFVSFDCSQRAEPLLYDAASASFSQNGWVDSEGYVWYYFRLEAQPAYGLQLAVQRLSPVGDPDVYLSYEHWPTLLLHDRANTQCDSCPGSISSPLSLPSSFLRPGMYRLLVHGYCCDAAAFTLTVSPYAEQPVHSWTWTIPVVGCLLFLLLALGLWMSLWMLRRRQWLREREEAEITRRGGVQRPQYRTMEWKLAPATGSMQALTTEQQTASSNSSTAMAV